MNKLTIVGGGSAYTPDILLSLLREKDLFAGWHWVLYDVAEEPARIVASLGQALVNEAGAEVKVTYTLDKHEALDGARFVLAQPRPGGLRHRALDERIPLRYGVIGQETVGPGGLSFAWRSIPVVMDLLETSLQIAEPGFWFVSYTNPAGMVCEAVLKKYPNARFIALCDEPSGVQREIARFLRVEPSRLEMEYRGVNHAGWVDHLYLKPAPGDEGEVKDVLPKIRSWARWIPSLVAPTGETFGTIRLIKEHGSLPDPYLRYYYYRDVIFSHLSRLKVTRAEYLMHRVEELYTHYEREAARPRPRLRMHRGHASHSDLAASVILTLLSGRRARFIIQQRNEGNVPGLPHGHAAQFPADVGPDGWHPVPVPPLTERQSALIRRIQDAEILNAEAALKGDRSLAIEAMALNPLVPSKAVAQKLVDELLEAHREFLPQFFDGSSSS
ncbi:MAG TPA: hypothetical protein GX510_00360 [Firmicutes bacterium]|nr:hypothetical protein [Candidatus Fermentithermobacillaceae bacterium]